MLPANARFRFEHVGILWTSPVGCRLDFAKHGNLVAACADPRPGSRGTWITPAMARAYRQLHELGAAHSLEVWDDDLLIGGIYGVALGRVFFGESMFSRRPDGSKFALAYLVEQLRRWDFPLLDCQVHNPHLESLGAVRIPRRAFVELLEQHCDRPPVASPWQLSVGLTDVVGPRPQRFASNT